MEILSTGVRRGRVKTHCELLSSTAVDALLGFARPLGLVKNPAAAEVDLPSH